MKLTDKAFLFAMTAHEAVGQKRKYTGEPYISHPLEVVMILKEAGYTAEPLLAAAYLHDVCEDTEINFGLIGMFFGREVLTLVQGVTNISKHEDGNRSERKEIDRNHIAKQPNGCKLIKIADIISNCRTVADYDKEFARVYLKEKLQMLEVLKGVDEELWNLAHSTITSGLIKVRNEFLKKEEKRNERT